MKLLIGKYAAAFLTVGIFLGSVTALQAIQSSSPVRWSEGANSGNDCGDEPARPAAPASGDSADQNGYGGDL